MKWENLTAGDFAEAVKKTKGVCILPIGVIEKHGDHCPLGSDLLAVQAIAASAAKKEQAVIFPSYYFGQINCARHTPGTICIRPSLVFELLENVCDEIARNGFRKILILNGHGGNMNMLSYFAMCMLNRSKNYVVYVKFVLPESSGYDKKINSVMKTNFGHAGEGETSVALHCFPELLKMKNVWKRASNPRGRLNHIPRDVFTGIRWYSNYPEHYAGDARFSSKEQGEKLVKIMTDCLVDAIRKIKKDRTTLKLQDEFFRRAEKSGKGK